jgi:hypothetical protein
MENVKYIWPPRAWWCPDDVRDELIAKVTRVFERIDQGDGEARHYPHKVTVSVEHENFGIEVTKVGAAITEVLLCRRKNIHGKYE